MKDNLLRKVGWILLPVISAGSIYGSNLGLAETKVRGRDPDVLEVVNYIKRNGNKTTIRDTNICHGKLRIFNSWTMFDEAGKVKLTYTDFGNSCKDYILSDNVVGNNDELSILFSNSSYDKRHIETYLDKGLDGIPEKMDYVSDSGNFSYRGDMPDTFRERNARAYYKQMLFKIKNMVANNQLRKKANRNSKR